VVAIRLAPDLVSIAAGGNDLLRPGRSGRARSRIRAGSSRAAIGAGLADDPAADLAWARGYAAPWLSRRLRGVSSGDGIEPKRPDLLPL
jgi:hypothetical protein